MWIPAKAAFRSGFVGSTQWDDANIGTQSFACGANTIASQSQAFACGSGTTASATRAFACGLNTTASGTMSFAGGSGATASGSTSFAMGNTCSASGGSSVAFGLSTTALGSYSTIFGNYGTAQAFASFVIGRYNNNPGTYNTGSWVATDPLFVIGNGSSTTTSNAMTVLKNGNVGLGTDTPAEKLNVTAGTLNGLTVTTNHVTGGGINTLLSVDRTDTKGLIIRNTATGVDVLETSGNGITVTRGTLEADHSTTTDYEYASRAIVDNVKTKCWSVINGTTENFLVYGGGQVYCREVYVKIGTLGDFVFNADYKLRSYSELHDYLKSEKHLPGIPSEKEVVSTNLNLGEMQALQLQKIEELTLYILDLNKRLEVQEKENKILEEQIKKHDNK
jgi:hypothetical protein